MTSVHPQVSMHSTCVFQVFNQILAGVHRREHAKRHAPRLLIGPFEENAIELQVEERLLLGNKIRFRV